MAKADSNGFRDYNGDTNVDVNCGRLIPQGNLDPNQAGSYAYMRRELDNAYKSSNTFKASTSYGFSPSITTKGLEGCWGLATFKK